MTGAARLVATAAGPDRRGARPGRGPRGHPAGRAGGLVETTFLPLPETSAGTVAVSALDVARSSGSRAPTRSRSARACPRTTRPRSSSGGSSATVRCRSSSTRTGSTRSRGAPPRSRTASRTRSSRRTSVSSSGSPVCRRARSPTTAWPTSASSGRAHRRRDAPEGQPHPGGDARRRRADQSDRRTGPRHRRVGRRADRDHRRAARSRARSRRMRRPRARTSTASPGSLAGRSSGEGTLAGDVARSRAEAVGPDPGGRVRRSPSHVGRGRPGRRSATTCAC